MVKKPGRKAKIDGLGQRRVALQVGGGEVDAVLLRQLDVADERLKSAIRRAGSRPERDPAVAAAERLVRWASAVAAAHRPGARLAINCIGDVDDAVAKRRVAPCFVRMHNQLRHRKHLKHKARYQYWCLLSALGAPVDITVAFGKERWKDWSMRENKWSYGVRHAYGLEGQRVVYSPTGCDKMIKGDPAGKGEESSRAVWIGDVRERGEVGGGEGAIGEA